MPMMSSGSSEAIMMPRHVAIIMDGNGRWAEKRGLHRAEGHRAGVKALKPIVETASERGIEVLTVYAFSSENWVRPKSEVDALMGLLVEFLASETPELKAQAVRIHTIGNLEQLPAKAQASLAWAKSETSQEPGMVLNLALNYGARLEIVRAVERWRKARPAGEELTAEIFAQYLDTGGLPDPDLVIRTSGELRVSNFLLWQIAYAELYVTDVLWPDFTPADFDQAIQVFRARERRFGGLG